MNNRQGQNTVVGHHVGFLLHYKRNLKSLEEEMNNLLVQNTIVEGKVNQAKHRCEDVDDNVLLWLKDVDETRQGVDKLMDEKTVKENMLCFNFSCPDFISRYRLSKQAEKKVVRIKHLAEDGSKIGTVSHPGENPPELEFLSSRDYKDFHSTRRVFECIVDALKDSNVNMIGVYGAGGVDSTAPAKIADESSDTVALIPFSKLKANHLLKLGFEN
ncbi:hypothetical protein Vadar_002218 [Vaccinium darrowii]|uniref:Uncharacterized protein n=1 Tax=Vaccinium darrowii TaxID=229202 RepID=A0ACB7YKQ5_9ERIC|nr:hypothetical protein Vadar_002218 [Vaccinium darrowii]